MAEYPLGLTTVPTPGTLVRATTNVGTVLSGQTPDARMLCHAYLIQAWKNNKGDIYVGAENMDRTTGVGVKAVLAVPTANSIPSFSVVLNNCPNGLNLSAVWLDADQKNEGALVTALVL